LKDRAKKLRLWNLFLPSNHFKEGAGFTNLEYCLMAESLGKSRTASEVRDPKIEGRGHAEKFSQATNCAAPDTGNMEVLARYGTEAQKKEWLEPLMDGRIRSAFLMTEPGIASSDASNIAMTMLKDGDHYVLNGSVRENLVLQLLAFAHASHRNGGVAAPATLDVRYTSRWARRVPAIRTSTSNNP